MQATITMSLQFCLIHSCLSPKIAKQSACNGHESLDHQAIKTLESRIKKPR